MARIFKYFIKTAQGIVLELLNETRNRDRILGSGPFKKREMRINPDLGLVQIRKLIQKQCEWVRIRIPESGFKNFYADPRFAKDPYRTVRIPSSRS
jgi:hypothetical protein